MSLLKTLQPGAFTVEVGVKKTLEYHERDIEPSLHLIEASTMQYRGLETKSRNRDIKVAYQHVTSVALLLSG